MILTISTAQFGLKYGLKKKKINNKEINKIKKIIEKNNINYLDTSTNYGDSEKRIGKLKIKNKKIITKILLPKKILNIEKWYNDTIEKSLTDLKVKSLYGLLIHDTANILQKNKKLLKLIMDSKKKKLVSKIGISVYEIKEVEKILKFWKPDIIQFPVNIFDQRFLQKKYLKKIKKFKIELHARSCFLQGILLSSKLKIGNKKSKQLFYDFINWCKVNRNDQLTSCLHFIKQIKHIDSLVVGFDDANQLSEIISAYKKKTVKVPFKFSNNERKLIDPRKWVFN